MSAVGDARKRLDESTARPESGEDWACKSCGRRVTGAWLSTDEWAESHYCPICLHDPAPVAEPADVEAMAELVCDLVDGNGYWARAGDAMRERYRYAARGLARRDEQRDREAVGRVVERVEALLASWENGSEAARYHWTRALCHDLRAALAEIEGA